jgi:hypothetical protein
VSGCAHQGRRAETCGGAPKYLGLWFFGHRGLFPKEATRLAIVRNFTAKRQSRRVVSNNARGNKRPASIDAGRYLLDVRSLCRA